MAAESEADIVIFGGAAGGGKSFWLLLELLKHTFIPGYQACIIRRTSTQLVGAGSIWEESRDIYPHAGGRCIEGSHRHWRFPAKNSKVWAAHCQHEKDLEGQHQGKQYAFVGVDELTQFTETMFWYFIGRMRTKIGIRPKFRGTCNPEPDSFLARLIDWWLDEHGDAIPERSGVIRYLIRVGDEIKWGATPDDLEVYAAEARARAERDGVELAPADLILSFTFIGSKVTDNKILLQADPQYYARLLMLPPVEQARYLHGNWKTRAAAGDYFQRGWFKQTSESEALIRLRQEPRRENYTKRLRIYDLASTPVKGHLVSGVARPADFAARPAGHEADWSASLLVCEAPPPPATKGLKSKYCIEDLQRYKDTPGALRQWVLRQAKIDGPNTRVAFFVDPGQAGVDQIESYKRLLRGHARVLELPTKSGPRDYSGTPAKQRNALIASEVAYNGRIYYRPHPNITPFFNELEAFPSKEVHDDWVDTLSGAIRGLMEIPSREFGYHEVKPIPVETLDRMGDRVVDEDYVRPGGTAGFERGF